jgi:hypothetical protein
VITELRRLATALNKREEIFKRAVKDNETEILDANTAQLSKGKDALGNFLDQYASDTYAQFKKTVKGSQAPLGIPDLHLEGDFYEGFVLKFDGAEGIIDSTDSKAGDLAHKYGQDIFGINWDEFDTSDLLNRWIELFKAEI